MGFAKKLYTKEYYMQRVLGIADWQKGTVRKEQKDVLDGLDLKGKYILDIGCGRGDVLRYCFDAGAHVVGIDFSPDAIKICEQTMGDRDCTLICGEVIDELPKLQMQYDYIFMFDSIEHIPAKETDTVLSNIRRLCKGRLIIQTPYYRVYEDYIEQGYFKRPSPTDKHPMTTGMHCTKYTLDRLLDKLMEHGFKTTDGVIYEPFDSSVVVVAYYTVDTPYQEEVKNLRESLRKLNLRYHIQGVPNRAKWEFNCGIKPEFLLDMLNRYPDKTLLYVDADAVVNKYPSFCDTFTADLAIYYLNGELLSGTIVFNKKAKPILEAWLKAQHDNPNMWDQKTLQSVLTGHGTLPPEYVKIFDRKDDFDPVITHYQASRRFKNKLTTVVELSGPADILKQLKRSPDGTVYIPRQNHKLEQWLDKNYVRIPNQLKWYPTTPDNSFIDIYKNRFKNQTCYLVGKGKSLDNLSCRYFGDGPIIALNEAFNKVKVMKLPNTFGTQQDTWMGACCHPGEAVLITSPRAYSLYKGVENVYMVNPVIFGLSETPSSYAYAIKLAKLFGCNKLVMLCFDACVNQDTNYAKCVGYEPTNMGDPKRFLNHKDGILKQAGDMPIEWVTPTDQSSLQSEVSDTLQQSQDNPVMHHEHDHVEHSTCLPTMPDSSSKMVLSLQQNLLYHLDRKQ